MQPETTVRPILTNVDVEDYVASAVREEDKRFEADDMDDAEGIELSLRPPSPLTDCDSGVDSDPEPDDVSLPPSAIAPPGSAEKARKRKHSNKQRQKKRIRLAQDVVHPAELYTAQPRIIESKLKEGRVYKVLGDISKLPTTSGGSWIGKKQQGIGEEPWELPTLLNDVNFNYIDWKRNVRFIRIYIGLDLQPFNLIPCAIAILYS